MHVPATGNKELVCMDYFFPSSRTKTAAMREQNFKTPGRPLKNRVWFLLFLPRRTKKPDWLFRENEHVFGEKHLECRQCNVGLISQVHASHLVTLSFICVDCFSLVCVCVCCICADVCTWICNCKLGFGRRQWRTRESLDLLVKYIKIFSSKTFSSLPNMIKLDLF